MVCCKMGSSGLLALSYIWGLFCIFQARYSTNSVNYNDGVNIAFRRKKAPELTEALWCGVDVTRSEPFL